MIIRGYFDDSGSHPNSTAYVLAGFLAVDTQWIRFAPAWRDVLSKEPALSYFKMSEANSFDGQFQRWPAPLRDQRVLELTEVADQFSVARIASIVMQADFNTHIKGAAHWVEFDDPYFMLFYHCVVLTINFIKELKKRDAWQPADVQLEFVFDEQGVVGANAVSWWDVLKQALDSESVEMLGAPPQFKSDREALPLQAADLYAWLVRNIFEEGHESIATKAVIQVLRHVPPYGGHLTAEMLKNSRPELIALSERYRPR